MSYLLLLYGNKRLFICQKDFLQLTKLSHLTLRFTLIHTSRCRSIEGAKKAAARAGLKHHESSLLPNKMLGHRISVDMDVEHLQRIRQSFAVHSSMSLRRSVSLKFAEKRRAATPRCSLLGRLGSEAFRNAYLSKVRTGGERAMRSGPSCEERAL